MEQNLFEANCALKTKAVSNRGVGLMEVMVSMVVISIGLLGLAPLFVTAMQGNVQSRDNTVASNLAEEKMSEIMALDPLPAFPFSETEDSLGTGKFTRITSMNDHVSDTLVPDGAVRVIIDVNWTDDQNIIRNSQLSTLILED